MNKRILCIGGLLLSLLLCACATKQANAPAPTAAPVETETPAATAVPTAAPVPAETEAPASESEADGDERILGHCISILDALPYAVDLEGDGEVEVVDLVTYVPADEYPRWAIALTRGGEEKRFETDIPYDMPYDLWVGDLDEDGAYELFFHGDMASDDYLIYAFRHDLTPLLFAPDERLVRWNEETEGENSVFGGYIDGFEDNHIVIEGAVDMLGTHFGVRNYSIGEDGIIGPVSSVWTFEEEDRPLTVTRALTAYGAKPRKEAGEAFTLQKGDTIVVLCSDGCERMWFETSRGQTGVLLLTPDEENLWLIDGVPEADYFDFLPYSG